MDLTRSIVKKEVVDGLTLDCIEELLDYLKKFRIGFHLMDYCTTWKMH